VAVRRFETPSGKEAQVDWGHLGTLHWEGQERMLWAFTCMMGYNRRMMAEVTVNQKIGTLLQMHEESFRRTRGVPEEILDRMKTVRPGGRRARRDRLASGVSGFCALLGIYTAAVPAVSSANQRKGRIQSEIPAAEFSLRTTKDENQIATRI
jgi:transposase